MKQIPCHPNQFYHWTNSKIPFCDPNPFNHVNNAVFSSYFEECRIDFFSGINEFKNSMKQGKTFVLIHPEINYIKPELFGKYLLAATSVEKYGNSNIRGNQAIYGTGQHDLKAVSKTTGVWFALNNNRPARLPEIIQKDQYLFKYKNL